MREAPKIRRISCTRSATRIEITPAFVAYRIAATMQHGIYAPATLRFAFPHSLDPIPTVASSRSEGPLWGETVIPHQLWPCLRLVHTFEGFPARQHYDGLPTVSAPHKGRPLYRDAVRWLKNCM